MELYIAKIWLWYIYLNYVPAWKHIWHFLYFTNTHFLFIYGVDIFNKSMPWPLTHWGRVTHICVSKLTSIGSDNGLSPGQHQAIIWTNAAILLIRTLGTNFSEIWKMASILSRPQCVKLSDLCSIFNHVNRPVSKLIAAYLMNLSEIVFPVTHMGCTPH